MRKTQFQQAIILSAELSNLSDKTNKDRTRNLQQCLQDLKLGFNVGHGKYNGRIETCFIVLVNSEADISTITDLGIKSFNQECVIYQDRKGESWLHYGDTQGHIGKLRQVTQATAWQVGKFTYMNDNYYAIA